LEVRAFPFQQQMTSAFQESHWLPFLWKDVGELALS